MNSLDYAKALNKFLLEMEKFTEPYSKEVQKVLEDISEVLRVGRIEFVYYDSLKNESMGVCDISTVYSMQEEFRSDAYYVGRRASERGSVFIFKYYQRANEAAWDDEELENIKVLDTILHTFNTKIRLTKFAERASLFDGELQIPNINFFDIELKKIMSERRFNEYGICFINLKRFGVVNQMLGREDGTKVMMKFISGLQSELGRNGTICRVGGDNFIILFDKSFADTITTYVAGQDIVYDTNTGESVIVRASAGLYLSNLVKENEHDAVDKAHIALQMARTLLGRTVVYYTDELQHLHEHANHIESVFKEAIEKEEFLVYYQPKVRLNDYTIAGAEALCRWQHDGTFVRPDDFVPVLERSNLICNLDFYMLDHVCRDLRSWIDRGLNVIRVSVNFSRRHLGDEKLLDKILEIIDRHSVPHKLIEIELTETTTDVAFHDLKRIVNGLHEHGIRTSVDDFGVGYSSLNLIRQVAWDVIKIDKSFLPDVSDKTSSQYLMFSHLLAMFRELGLKCIVEGVETIEQVKMLKDNKCFLAQGYFFDKPLGLEEFESRLVG